MATKNKTNDFKSVMGGSLEDLFSTSEERGQQMQSGQTEERSFVTAQEISSVKRKLKTSAVNPREMTTIKKGFFMKPKVMEAFKLHKMLTGQLGKEDSKIINAALEMYLSRELDTLNGIPFSIAEDERISEAFKRLK